MCQGYLRINDDAFYEATSIVVMEHKYVPCATHHELLPVQHNIGLHAHDVRRPASSATNSAPSSMDKVPFNTWFRTATRRLLIDIDAKPNAADSGTFSTARVRCETSEKTPTERRELIGLDKGCLDDMGCAREASATNSIVLPRRTANVKNTMQASFPRKLPPVGDYLDAVRRRRRRLFTTHSHLQLTAAHTATEAKTRWMLRWGKRSNYCGDETTIRIVIWLAEVEEARARARDDSMTLMRRDSVIEPE